MRGQSKQDSEIDVWAEHLVVLDVVGTDQGRTRERIYRSLRDVEARRLDTAIARLVAAGVVQLHGNRVVQTAALNRLDRLHMICI
jgi:hypothetical protein